MDRVPMTPGGYARLKADLKQIQSVDRPHNVKEIEEAIAHGDLKENAEYHAAKDRQGHLNARIALIEDSLARAQVIELGNEVPSQVRFGCTVRLEDVESGEEVRYTIVGEYEADISKGLISVTSPVARALIGKEVSDTTTVRVPKGTRELDILEILVGSSGLNE